MLSQTSLPRKEADSSIMGYCRHIPLRFSNMHRQKLLMLCWPSFLRWCNERVICLFSYNADQYSYFGRRGQCSPLIVGFVRQKIVDALLTLFVRVAQRACHLPFWLLHQPIRLVGGTWHWSPLIVESVRPEMEDALLTLTLITYK